MNAVERTGTTLRDYFRVLLRRKWIVVLGAIATATPAVVLSLMQAPVYEASARMLVQSLPGDTLFGNGYQGYIDPERVVANEIQVLESQVVYDRVKQDLALTANPPGVSGSGLGSTDVIQVTVRSGDPTTARVLANAYVSAYISVKRSQTVGGLDAAGKELQAKVGELQDRIDQLDRQIATASEVDKASLDSQRRVLIDQQAVFKQRLDQIQVDTALTSGNAQLVQSAGQPVTPVAPTPRRTAVLALLVGLLLGLGAAFIVDYFDDAVRSDEDLAEVSGNRPILALVPVDPPPDSRPIAVSRPNHEAVESYRTLRTNVEFLGFDGALRSIQVTSSVPGEGKTTTAANLAVVLAQAGNRVVLVDADLRRPRVHAVFGLDGTKGLTSALVGDSPELSVRRIDDHLSVVTSGITPPNPSELLGGRRMLQVIELLYQQFDFVILDSAPVLPVSDAVALSRHVDGVLVVAQAGRTSQGQVKRTLASLEQVSASVMGMVLNKSTRGHNRDEYGYGYRSDHRHPEPAE